MWLRCASPSEAGGASQLVEDDPAAALFEWASRGGAYVSEALRLSVESAKRPRGLVISATDVPAGTFSLSALRDMNGIPELTRVTACTGLTGLSCLQAPCF
jgi:hypothetical protein